MREKFQSLYRQLIFRCKESKNRIYLYIISFLESIIFPLPTDIFLIPFVLAEKKNYWHLALMTTIFSVLGGCCSYLVGLLLWEQANLFFLEYYPSISTKLNSFIFTIQRIWYSFNSNWRIFSFPFQSNMLCIWNYELKLCSIYSFFFYFSWIKIFFSLLFII